MTDPIEEHLFEEHNEAFMKVHDYVKQELAKAFRNDKTMTVDEALTWADGVEMVGEERMYGKAVLDSFENYQDIIEVSDGEISKGVEYTKIV